MKSVNVLMFFEAISRLSSVCSDMSSAFYPVSSGKLQSLKNTTRVERSLLSCVVTAKQDVNTFAVNYDRGGNSCEIIEQMDFAIRFDVHKSDGSDWQNVILKGNGKTLRSDGTTQSSSDCSANGIGYFQDKCYQYIGTTMAMFNAVKHCEAKGGLLLSVETQEEQDFLCNISRGFGEIWTSGTYDKTVPFWASTSLDIVFTNWEGGSQTGSVDNSAIFVDMSVSGCPWKLEAFTSQKAFVCEFNG